VQRALDALVAATGLRGLASADGLLDGGMWWLLEINPRPGATLDILDRRAMPLLRAHIEACRGRLVELAPPAGAAASQILYAGRPIRAVPDCPWPDHVRDRPEPGSPVLAGAPLCTVTAEGRDAQEAVALLRARVDRVRAMVRTGSPHDAPAHA
jgi:predicted ATP-grasp superfamily ATP-dependent carboligase